MNGGGTVWITKCFPTNESSVFNVPPLPLPEGCGDRYQVPRPPTSNQPSWGLLGWMCSSPSLFLLLVLFSSLCTAHLYNHRRRPRPRPLEDDPPLVRPSVARSRSALSRGWRQGPGVERGLPADCEDLPAPEWDAHRPNTLPGGERGGAGGEPPYSGAPGVAPWQRRGTLAGAKVPAWPRPG